MKEKLPHILLLEPYFGGSHRSFLEGLQHSLPFRFTPVTLPARKWKMRMQLAAPWMADETVRLIRDGASFDGVLCSTFMDVAIFMAMLGRRGMHLPVAMYFHENQFAYPNRIKNPAWHQFAALNFTSALAADTIAFNSMYNRDTFLEGVALYLKKAVDTDVLYFVEELRKKSAVLYPGIDFGGCHQVTRADKDTSPVIVWNHRWEHDKDPETFFRTLMELAGNGAGFRLIVLGQHFERRPGIFAGAKKALADRILHFGYVSDRKEYIRLLRQGDLIVSTAVHEFFGIAVLEAVRCGCRPLVPDRLSYRELFPKQYRYSEGGFAGALASFLKHPRILSGDESRSLTERFSWKIAATDYEQWLKTLLRNQ